MTNYAFDEVVLGGEQRVFVRGRLSLDSLGHIAIPKYQREKIAGLKHHELIEAIGTDQLGDIDLGMRGTAYRERDGVLYLHDPVYTTDGFQRLAAAIAYVKLDPEAQFSLGAMVHFGSTYEQECVRFEDINTSQTRVSPNVLLRNRAINDPRSAIGLVYRMTTSTSPTHSSFPLNQRVQWGQSKTTTELIPANGLFKTICYLHGHLGYGVGNNVPMLCDKIEKIYLELGQKAFVDNIRAFFEVVDNSYGIRTIEYRDGSVHMNAGFLFALAQYFSHHEYPFWKDDALAVRPADVKRLGQFNLQEPSTNSLARARNDQARSNMEFALIQHMSKGRTKFLPRLRAGGLIAIHDEGDAEVEDTSGGY